VNGQLQQTGSNSGSTSSTSTTTGTTTTGGQTGTPVKLYGIDYDPRLPDDTCPTLAQVETDVQALVNIAYRVRIYSVDDCNGGLLLLQAIKALNAPLNVTLGIWLDTYYGTEFPSEWAALVNVIQTVGLSNVDTIIVGSETQYRGDFSATILEGFLQNVSTTLHHFGYNSIDVVTADVIYNLVGNTGLISHEPVVYANQFPFWQGYAVNASVALISSTIQSLVPSTGGKQIFIGETGWPTAGKSYENAYPGLPEAQQYLNDLVCYFYYNNIPYFWFEAFDEPWKPDTSGLNLGVEPYFGVYTQDRTPKPGISLPIYC